MKCTRVLLYIQLLIFVSCSGNTPDVHAGSGNNGATNIPQISYTIAGTYPHDTTFFTEGLCFYNGALWESTGLEGKSRLVQLDLNTGRVLQQVSLAPELFGEGLVILRDTAYQLTWQNKKMLVYTVKDLKKIKEVRYDRDGWGLTTNGTELIASDGSSNLYFYEPGTMRLLRIQSVTENGAPVFNINELEYVNGSIYANQWQTNYLLKIDPQSGLVTAKMVLDELNTRAKAMYHGAEYLNGIAYDSSSKRFLVTGKNWPQLFALNFNP